MQYVALALTAASAYSQYQQGKAQQERLNRQAELVELQGRSKAVSHKQDGIRILDSMLEQMSYANAYAGAGSIDPFSGSKLCVGLSLQAKGLREFNINGYNQTIALDMSNHQAEMLRYEGRIAKKQGKINALTTMAMGTASIYGSGGFSGSGAGTGAGAGSGVQTTQYMQQGSLPQTSFSQPSMNIGYTTYRPQMSIY